MLPQGFWFGSPAHLKSPPTLGDIQRPAGQPPVGQSTGFPTPPSVRQIKIHLRILHLGFLLYGSATLLTPFRTTWKIIIQFFWGLERLVEKPPLPPMLVVWANEGLGKEPAVAPEATAGRCRVSSPTLSRGPRGQLQTEVPASVNCRETGARKSSRRVQIKIVGGAGTKIDQPPPKNHTKTGSGPTTWCGA